MSTLQNVRICQFKDNGLEGNVSQEDSDNFSAQGQGHVHVGMLKLLLPKQLILSTVTSYLGGKNSIKKTKYVFRKKTFPSQDSQGQ